MADTTFEEARRCPKCETPGKPAGVKFITTRNADGTRRHGITAGAKLQSFVCVNERCKWFDTPWEVQINPDGTIPPADMPSKMRDRLRPLDPALAATMKDRFQSLQEAEGLLAQGKNAGEIRR